MRVPVMIACVVLTAALATAPVLADKHMPSTVGGLIDTPAATSVQYAQLKSARERERVFKPKDTFKECDACPEMIVVPSGSFTMGSPPNEPNRDTDENPQRVVTFARPFAVGKYAVTFAEWDACVADGGCNNYQPSDEGWGRGKQPVVNVNWSDAKTYLAWLSRKTGKTYRLLSESEREYVTRAGTKTPYWTGASITEQQANFSAKRPVPVDQYQPNPWGLYQVHGNIWEWVEDCWNDNYNGAPTDGSPWLNGSCGERVYRGGSWVSRPVLLRSALRDKHPIVDRLNKTGFRVARSLP
jgi:formylglycine-generating enzyme required for sulfatase activity